MAYRVIYSGAVLSREEIRPKTKNKSFRSASIIAVAIAIILMTSIMKESRLYRCLLPGEPEVTEAAAVHMLYMIREGETVGEAFAAFCRDIIDGAEFENGN